MSIFKSLFSTPLHTREYQTGSDCFWNCYGACHNDKVMNTTVKNNSASSISKPYAIWQLVSFRAFFTMNCTRYINKANKRIMSQSHAIIKKTVHSSKAIPPFTIMERAKAVPAAKIPPSQNSARNVTELILR